MINKQTIDNNFFNF